MAQALVRFLENQYAAYDGREHPFVRGIFMLPGHGNVVGLGQAVLQEAKRLEIYQGKNEQGQTHAAVAFARQRKRKEIFAVTSSVGPGAANMLTAAATATANNIPVLILPGDVYACRQPDPVLQQIEQPYDMSISTNDAFRPVCRYWDRVVRPEQLMSAMLNAFRVLTDPADTGAVCVALSQDVEGEAYDYPEHFFRKRVYRIERRPPESAAVEQAAALIRAAKRPMLICGGGVRYSEAHAEFRCFAETFHIPFGETQAGKSAVPWDCFFNMGGIGVTGTSCANEIAKGADVIIGVGTRYTDFTTSSKWLFREDAKFININVSVLHASKFDAVKITADAKTALCELKEKLSGWKADYDADIKDAKEKWVAELARLDGLSAGDGYVPNISDANSGSALRFAEDVGTKLTQTEALGFINASVGDEAIVIGASGSLPGCMQRMWRCRGTDTYNMEYGYSCMGYEISGALGVKIAEPEKDVYAMAGAGSFCMLHSELLTAVQERKKINICLFDNASFGCINNLQIGQGNDSLCTELRYRSSDGRHCGAFLNVDYAAIAAGYGAKSYRVRTADELKTALEDAKKIKDVPVLFDIKVLPKSMTDGYGAWWRVGSVEISADGKNCDAWNDHLEHVKDARQY